MVDKSSSDFSSASSSPLSAAQVWEKVQKTLDAPETRRAARILPASQFMFGPAIEDMEPEDFARPVAADPLVLAFFRTPNKVFLITRTMPYDAGDYEMDFDEDKDEYEGEDYDAPNATLSLQELTGGPSAMGIDDIQYTVFVCQQTRGGAQILTDLPAHKGLEIMEYAKENGLLIEAFSPEDAQEHLRRIAALRAEVYGADAPGVSADFTQNNHD